MSRFLPFVQSLFGALTITAAATAVSAHGLDAHRVELVLHENVVEVTATPPSSFVAFADADGDGLLTVAEVSAHRDEIRRALAASLALTDHRGRAGALDRSDVSVPRGHDVADDARGRDHLRFSMRLTWAEAPRELRLRCAFARTHPVSVYATRAAAGMPGMLALVGDPEGAVLQTLAEFTLLREPAGAAPSTSSSVTASPATRVRTAGSAGLPAGLWAVLVAMMGIGLALTQRRKGLSTDHALDARGGSQ